jgi:hypothetical protein
MLRERAREPASQLCEQPPQIDHAPTTQWAEGEGVDGACVGACVDGACVEVGGVGAGVGGPNAGYSAWMVAPQLL